MGAGITNGRRRFSFTDCYLTTDPRSLAIGRIALATALLWCLIARFSELDHFYTNNGVLPNHVVLWRPYYQHSLSFFLGLSYRHEALVGFVACFVAFSALLVGYRTRVAQIASFVCAMSLRYRVPSLLNGGDVVIGLLAFWTMFLPTGRRYSIDSMRARLRAYREARVEELENRGPSAPDNQPVVSLAVMALFFQLVAIYALNCLQKTGWTWRNGSAVHYTLHQDRIATALGVWLREHLSERQVAALTWSTLVVEAAIPLCIILPVAREPARRLAAFLIIMLHVGIGLCTNLGVFAPAMIAFGVHLVPGEDHSRLARWWNAGLRPLKVAFDSQNRLWFEVARILARLDANNRLIFVRHDAIGNSADSTLDRHTLVIDDGNVRLSGGAGALAEIARRFLWGAPLAAVLILPGLKQLTNTILSTTGGRRRGLASPVNQPSGGDDDRRRSELEAPSPVRPSRWGHYLSEGVVGCSILVAAYQLMRENHAFRSVKPPQSEVLDAAVSYLGLFQGWSMFAPDAPTQDLSVSIDAVTVDGRHVDPLNMTASANHQPGLQIPPHLGQSSVFGEYIRAISWQPEFHHLFIDWIGRHHLRTRNDSDQIIAFDAYVVEDDSPPPGKTKPMNTRWRRFLSHRF